MVTITFNLRCEASFIKVVLTFYLYKKRSLKMKMFYHLIFFLVDYRLKWSATSMFSNEAHMLKMTKSANGLTCDIC